MRPNRLVPEKRAIFDGHSSIGYFSPIDLAPPQAVAYGDP
jgi:hypothetical protein